MAGETKLTAGFRWAHHASVGSTNDVALSAARAGEPVGLWVTADRQTGGRGRGGRSWASEPGNFHGSLLYRTEKPLAELSLLPLAAALGVKEALEELAPEAAQTHAFALKWPNDVLIAGAKVAGILLESEKTGDGALAVAIGCGINVARHPADTAFPATHLAAHGAAPVVEEVLRRLSRRMNDALRLFEKRPGQVRERWLAAAHGLGRRLTVRLASQTLHGTFAGLDEGGRLLLDEGCRRRTVATGDLFFGAQELSGEAAP